MFDGYFFLPKWGVLTPAWCWQFGLLICKPASGLKLQQKEKFRYITCSGLAQFELLGHFLDCPFIHYPFELFHHSLLFLPNPAWMVVVGFYMPLLNLIAKGDILLQAARGGQSVTRAGSILIMFGGEDSKGHKMNDLHILDLKSLMWLPLHTTSVHQLPTLLLSP